MVGECSCLVSEHLLSFSCSDTFSFSEFYCSLCSAFLSLSRKEVIFLTCAHVQVLQDKLFIIEVLRQTFRLHPCTAYKNTIGL